MGIRNVSNAVYEESVLEEEWTLSDWKDISDETIRQIANEVWGFGLEVEVADTKSDQVAWRVVAMKT